MRIFRVGSLFSGVGGLDLGLEQTGRFHTRWQVENNPFAVRVLERHWPNVKRWGDVRMVHPLRDGWDCEVICGGFPCTQTSFAAAVHGRRHGLEGKDSGLWWEMLRIVREVRPPIVIVENPQGASKWQDTITQGLEGAGYDLPEHPIRVSARDVGAPHLRWRLFWIANRHGAGLQIAWPEGPPKIDCEQGRALAGDTWAAAEPGILRMDDGLSGRVYRRERIECLGRAVVPAVGRAIGELILKHLKE